mmetsp:Transcript_14263/g.23619  ORF Transcript_14263/g.23619 Transcript_14263/m.23619 type:complete len:183 (-) Transcript_14263:173-721(-)|eukprot:CAMPEP_0119012524 /NCGR_PEP_ID=MMETSP1176-20130426/6862_1 /TAXON_ID=265551 /ORGANISM="Synedropsis recta cf, Strain CCMP1620" /LENGTH=182 /DNA_ID=CAMNT_0006965505 /DNA_START=58 /DNA_END=606 /DNA_ORIENTATION=-
MSYFDWAEWGDSPRLRSEVSSLPCDGIVVIDDSSPISMITGMKQPLDPDMERDSLFECPDAVLSEDDASSSSDSSSIKEIEPSAQLKRVCFSTVEVREYSLTIGDHPLCRDGLPITLDWKYNEESTFLNIPYENRTLKQDSFPKRLDYDERLARLQRVTGITENHMLLIQNHRMWSRKDKEM